MKRQREPVMSIRHLALPALALAVLAGCNQAPPADAGGVPPALVSRQRQALFDNGGFETNSFTPGWTVTRYRNTGLPTNVWPPTSVAGLNLGADSGAINSYVLYNAVPESQRLAGLTATDAPRWPKIGTHTAVINRQGANYQVNSIKQTYTTTYADVDPADGRIHARWVLAPALQDPDHPRHQQPYFFVSLRNLTTPRAGTLYTTFNFANEPGVPWKTQGTGSSKILYTDWRLFDVAPTNVELQPGDTIELEVFAAGCSQNGHWGEVYVDGFGAFLPGLSVTKRAPETVNVDSTITYDFLVKNTTANAVSDVVVDDVLPANTTFASVTTPTGVTCTTPAVGATGTVLCNLGWMNPGASQTFQLTVRAFEPAETATVSTPSATTFTDSSKAWATDEWRGYTLFVTSGTGAGQERVVASNSATVLTVANAFSPALDTTSRVALVAPPLRAGLVTAGANTTVDVSIAAPAVAANALSGQDVVILSGPGAGQRRTIVSNTASATAPRLTVTPAWTTNPTSASTYAIKEPVLKVVNGNYGVAGSTLARLLGPAVETRLTAGVTYADLAITKTDGVAGVAWGTQTTYTITATNHGPSNVTGATVTDTLPSQLSNAAWTCVGADGGSCATASGTGDINHQVNLPVGGSATFTLTADVTTGTGTGTLYNLASVTTPSGVIDNQPQNNQDGDLDSIGPLVALTLQKGAGLGQGVVTSSPAAINCGNTCDSQTASFLSGTQVTLTAVARTGDTFLGWSGGGCSGTGTTCTVTLTAATTVTADFDGVSVTASVLGSNGGIACTPTKLAQGGDSVCTLTPDTGYGVASLDDNGDDVKASLVYAADGGITYTVAAIAENHSVVASFGALAQTPTISSPEDNDRTNDATPTISGTTSANTAVTVYADGVAYCTTTSNGAGDYSCASTTDLADGAHVFTAIANNGNGPTPPSNTVHVTVDTTAPSAPVVSTPADGSRTNDTTPEYTGTAEAGSTVTVYVDGVAVGTTTADGTTGAWTLTPTVALSEGQHTVEATATDAAGNTSVASDGNTFTVDVTAPAAPVITSPLAGASTSPTPVITGTAEPGSTVTVYDGATVIGTALADGTTGEWTLTPGTPLAAGPHTLTATATDVAGNTSPASAQVGIIVRDAPPPTPVLSTPGDGALLSSATPTYSGTAEPGSTVTVYVDGQQACTALTNAAGVFTCTPTTALPDGAHTVVVEATNPVGSSPASSPSGFTVDTTAPTTPVVVGPADGSRTADATPTITGTGEPGSTITVRIDGTDAGTAVVAPDGTWTFDVATALIDGPHTVSAIAKDAAGNVSTPSATNTFTVGGPATSPVLVAPGDNSTVGTGTPAFAGTATPGATVTVFVDGLVACTAVSDAQGAFGCTPASPLGDGPHSATATVVDAGGQVLSSNTNGFTVDTVAPTAPLVLSPADGSTTADTTPTVKGLAEPFSTVTISIDGVEVGTAVADASGLYTFETPSPLAAGAHTVSATATDAAGNTSAASPVNDFTVGAVNGPTLVTPADGSLTNDAQPPLSGTATPGATVEAMVDGQVVCTDVATPSGFWSCTPITALADGAHAASAREQGSADVSNTNGFAIDTAAPGAPVILTPGEGTTTGDRPTVTGTAEPGSRVSISIDGAEVCVAVTDAQGQWRCTVPAALSAGPHVVTATATDAAGNVSAPSPSRGFTVGTQTAPGAPTLVTPADGGTVPDGRPAMSGTAEAGSTVTVYVDGQPVCSAVTDAQGNFTCQPVAALPAGPHEANAVASSAGGTSPASNTVAFIVTGAEPPPPTITSPASGESLSDTTPTFTGTATPGALVTVHEGGEVLCTAVADGNGDWSCDAPTLAEGAHHVTATATDANGESAPSPTRDFVIDTTPPTVTITTPPATDSSTAVVDFTSSEPGSTFECSLDGAAFAPCTSPLTQEGLGNGPHVLEVRAIDAAGNVGPATRYEWTVAARPAGEFTGGCGCTSVDPTALLGALGLLLLRRRRRRR